MNSIKPKVNVTAIGPVSSAGTVILISATGKRSAFASSFINIHANRPLKTNQKFSKDNILTDSFVNIYKAKTKIPNAWYPLTGAQYYLTPVQAKEYGLIDRIINN